VSVSFQEEGLRNGEGFREREGRPKREKTEKPEKPRKRRRGKTLTNSKLVFILLSRVW
jgi:hypothetical protein